jgi:MFS family permease
MLHIAQFRAMRAPVRALVFLFWIYVLAGHAVNIFLQIYLYQLFNSLQINIVTAMFSFTGLMLGFCGYGAMTAYYGLNAKYGFLLSFVSQGLGLFILSCTRDVIPACIALAIVGVGGGAFWLTIHTYELTEMRDHERDVYSTFLAAGEQLISVIGPAFATLLLWLSHNYGLGDFTLLFMVTPAIFLLGGLFFGALTNYRPEPIRRYDLSHFVTERRNKAAQIYLMGEAAMHVLQKLVLPLVAITVLGTPFNVGGFNTIFAIAGALTLLAVGAYRHPRNRLSILGFSSFILALFNTMLGFSLTLTALIIFTVGTAIMYPIMRVSQHAIDLQTMDSVGHPKSDFYPTMIFRDLSLWLWRMVTAFAFLSASSFMSTDLQAISLGLYFTAGTVIIMYIGARVLLALPPKVEPV